MRPLSTLSLSLAGGLMLVSVVGRVEAEELGTEARIAEALKITTDAAKRYAFTVEGSQPGKLVLHDKSILHWSNPIAGEVYGNVFVWTREGRPQVIGSMLQWYTPNTHGSHEFHSLTTEPINGTWDGQPVWTSKQPGIERRPVTDAQALADSQPARLRQMRAISRQFTIRKTDRDGVSSELRLLSQPVYRYGNSDSAVLDGAIFTFVQGTDPEVFVIIEARKVDGVWSWQYALARMNSVQFVAKYQESEVWRVEGWPWSKTKNGREPYTHFGPFDRNGEKRR